MNNYLDRYLAGEAPQHPERLELPTDEELDAAEAEFDRLMAERESQTIAEEKPRGRVVRLWPWAAAAASVLLLIGVGAMLLTDGQKPQERIVAKVESPSVKDQQDNSRDSVLKQESVPVIPLETADSIKKLKEKYRMPRPPKHYMAKAETEEIVPEPEAIDEIELAERAFAEERRRMEMEMMAQMSGSLQADFKAMTDEIRNRGERMTQHVEIAMSEDE
jgi:hypothetical protein